MPLDLPNKSWEEKQMKKESKEYTMELRCRNCAKKDWINIPIGTLVRDYLKKTKHKCGYCECPLFHDSKNGKTKKAS